MCFGSVVYSYVWEEWVRGVALVWCLSPWLVSCCEECVLVFGMTVKNVRADAGALVTTFRDVSTGDVARAGSLSVFEWLDFWLFM